MAESDSLIEVLKEIRDEIRAVRTDLLGRNTRLAASGIRTERVQRDARWRIVATAGIGAVALVALVLALRTGGQAPVAVEAAPTAGPRATTAMTSPPVPVPAPTEVPAPAPPAKPAPMATATPPPARAPRPAATRPAAPPLAAAPAVAVAPNRHLKPAVAPKLPGAVAPDEDEAIAFSPPPRRVRVHKMSYGPIESEPAKL